MAEQQAQDVVVQAQPVGDITPSGAPAETTSTSTSGGEEGPGQENGVHNEDDAATRSDTDTSRADGSVAGDVKDARPVKKFPVAKPMSFAKYSVPKAVANAAVKTIDKGMSCVKRICHR